MASCVPFTPDYTCCEEWDTLDPTLQERATELAWATLRTLSGGQIGNCPVTVRPCVEAPCDVCAGWDWLTPRIIDGRWVNMACNPPKCWCEPVCEIVLDSRIALVEQISVDGALLDVDTYVVHNGHRIVRTDGQCWPSCQRLDRPLSEACTLGVTFVPGIKPGTSGEWAAGVLACEFAKACTGGKCRLPSSVTSISRQGVTMTFTEGMFAGGVTGIREVDAYLYSINPNHHTRPAMVWSPDVPWVHHRYPTDVHTVGVPG